MQENRYIAIEGPIGVGKTSLARLLSKCFNAQLVLEDININPFLENFYNDRERYAFQTQLFFLLNRYKQQAELIQRELFNRCLINDYLFAKDKIFAYLNLAGTELELYREIYSLLDVRLPKPDLVIYLQADTEMLKNRIASRGRHFEKNISKEYLESLNTAFNNFFFHYSESPVLIINTTKIDYVNREKDLEDLIRKIASTKKGKEYYMPLGSK